MQEIFLNLIYYYLFLYLPMLFSGYLSREERTPEAADALGRCSRPTRRESHTRLLSIPPTKDMVQKVFLAKNNKSTSWVLRILNIGMKQLLIAQIEEICKSIHF